MTFGSVEVATTEDGPMSQTMTRSQPDGAGPIRKPPRWLPFPLNIYQTAVGKKWVMAVTGIGLIGFVVAHMIGNLHLYEGPEQINAYGEALRDLGGHLAPRTFVLWILRLGLIVMFILHIHSAYGLTRINMAANAGAKYQDKRNYVAANFASRTMRWTGVIIGLFIVFHLADLTWGKTHPGTYVRGNIYYNAANSLQTWPIALIYIFANIALALHIFHGAWSMFQSLGINNPKYNQLRRMFAGGLAAFILVGNLSFPIMAMSGVIDKDNAEPHAVVEVDR
jgi:succinate dehydrogenase / fumarate reductase, cytochrome b subunit